MAERINIGVLIGITAPTARTRVCGVTLRGAGRGRNRIFVTVSQRGNVFGFGDGTTATFGNFLARRGTRSGVTYLHRVIMT